MVKQRTKRCRNAQPVGMEALAKHVTASPRAISAQIWGIGEFGAGFASSSSRCCRPRSNCARPAGRAITKTFEVRRHFSYLYPIREQRDEEVLCLGRWYGLGDWPHH